MSARFPSRIAGAQKAMARRGLDVLVVTNRENLIYFTGLTQIECLALLIPVEGEASAIALWLDADYVRENSGLKTHAYFFPRETLGLSICKHISAFGYRDPKIGFERYFVDFAVYDALRGAFNEANFIGAADLFYKLRSVKEPEELTLIEKACDAACKGMRAAMTAVRPGVSELDVLAEAEYAMLKAGSGGSPFRPQVVAGQRTLLAHPTASSRKIQEGEIVVVHLGATCEGYCAKIARTAAVGTAPKPQTEVHALILRALQRAEAVLRPGATTGQVDAAAREVIEQAGFGKFYLESVGFGVGLRQSEFYPVIGRGGTDLIEPGMVIDLLLPTIYRRGVGGPRITDIFCVGETESRVLTRFPRDLVRI